jgi:hypothetical protein
MMRVHMRDWLDDAGDRRRRRRDRWMAAAKMDVKVLGPPR